MSLQMQHEIKMQRCLMKSLCIYLLLTAEELLKLIWNIMLPQIFRESIGKPLKLYIEVYRNDKTGITKCTIDKSYACKKNLRQTQKQHMF